MAAANHRTRGSIGGDAVSDTPRTDAATKTYIWNGVKHIFVEADVARQLERELAAVTADLEFRRELGALQQQEYDKVTAERDVLRADLCAFAIDMEKQLSASQQEARRLREALDAIMASAKVACCATTDPMMTDALVGIGKRCKDAIEND